MSMPIRGRRSEKERGFVGKKERVPLAYKPSVVEKNRFFGVRKKSYGDRRHWLGGYLEAGVAAMQRRGGLGKEERTVHFIVVRESKSRVPC